MIRALAILILAVGSAFAQAPVPGPILGGGAGGGGSTTPPITGTFTTGTSTCTPGATGSCTAAPAGGIAGNPSVVITHNLTTANPEVAMYDVNGQKLGPNALASITSICAGTIVAGSCVAGTQVVTVTLSAALTSATFSVFKPGQGATGPAGPGSSVASSGSVADGNLAVWDGSSGGLIKDGGVVPSTFTFSAANNGWYELWAPAIGSSTTNIAGIAKTVAFYTFRFLANGTFTTSSKLWTYINTVNSTSCGGAVANCGLNFWITDSTVTTLICTGSVTGLTATGAKAIPFTAGCSLTPGMYTLALSTDSATVLLQSGVTAGNASWFGTGGFSGVGVAGAFVRYGVCANPTTGTGTLVWPVGGCGAKTANPTTGNLPVMVFEF